MRSAAITAVVVAGLLVAVVLAVEACTGSETVSKEEYSAAVVSARDRVDFALAQITEGQGTFEELLDRMETAAGRIDEAADELADAGSAEGFDEDTKTLVAAFHQLSADLAGTAHDAGQPGMEGLLSSTDALQFPSWVKANKILAGLAEQGIDVTPIGSH